MNTLILSRSQVASLLTMRAAVDAVEAAFLSHGRGQSIMPAKVYLSLPTYGGDFRAMPSYADGRAGLKWVNAHPENPARFGLPTVMGVFVLSDPESARPLAIMDATLITAMRTGAAAAVATKHLLGRAPRTLGLVGSGVQARWVVQAHRALWPDIEVVASDLVPVAAGKLVEEMGGRLGSLEEACGCDVVCTATPSRVPVVQRAWIRPGTLIIALGADAPGKQELDPQILQEAVVVVDDLEQACESGEVNIPLHTGALERNRIRGTLGEVMAGVGASTQVGVEGTTEHITVFDSTGLAVQDLALARVVEAAARAAGAFASIDLLA